MRHKYALIDAAHFERRRFECGRIIMRAIVVISTVLTMLAASPLSSRPAAAEPIDPAQAIAQKFIDADRAAPAPPRAKPKPARVTNRSRRHPASITKRRCLKTHGPSKPSAGKLSQSPLRS